MSASTPDAAERGGVAEVFGTALRLGLRSFGGPIAHIEYFRREYVERRRWLTPEDFADLVTMCSVLPGPTSSQLGMAIGLRRAGMAGLAAAWLGFTLPSALLMAAAGLSAFRYDLSAGVHGLKLAALAVVLAAVTAMVRISARTLATVSIAIVSLIAAVLAPHPGMHLSIITTAALVGILLLRQSAPPSPASQKPWSRRTLIVIVLMLAPIFLSLVWTGPCAQFLLAIYRSGALVFGGGHVVLPLLEAGVVGGDMVNADAFLAGYGIAQVIPGPLFTFATYLGALTHGIGGAALATLAIFLPGALLLIAVLPMWERIRAHAPTRAAISGANAAVVGLLASVPLLPISRAAITTGWDLLIVGVALALLLVRRIPVLAVIGATAVIGALTTL